MSQFAARGHSSMQHEDRIAETRDRGGPGDVQLYCDRTILCSCSAAATVQLHSRHLRGSTATRRGSATARTHASVSTSTG